MEQGIYLVSEGIATALEANTRLPAASGFGQDWLVCLAPSVVEALEIAAAVDSEETDPEELLSEVLSSSRGAAVDALAWHLYSRHLDADEPDGERVTAIRWGAPRTDGHSIDHAHGDIEPGISACIAREVAGGWQLEDGTSATSGTILQLISSGATPYLVRGIAVGSDSDGSVSLSHVERLAELRWDAASKSMVAQ